MNAEKIARYRELIKVWGSSDQSDNEESDKILDELDTLWYSMTREEMDEVDPAGAEMRKSRDQAAQEDK